MIKKFLILLTFCSSLTIMIVDASATTDAQHIAQIGDYKLFANISLVNKQEQSTDIPLDSAGCMVLRAQNHDQSNRIEFRQTKSYQRSYINYMVAGALINRIICKVGRGSQPKVLAMGALGGWLVCGICNFIDSRRVLEISVLDRTKDSTDSHKYRWLSRPGADRPAQMKRFATYWIQKYKCNQGEALDALMNKKGIFPDEQGRVTEIS